MTKEQLAELLNGNGCRKVMTKEQEQTAKENNLLVLFGLSDDLLEMRGAIYDDVGVWDGGDYALLLKDDKYSYTDADLGPNNAEETMILPLDGDYNNDNNPRLIRAEWCPEDETQLSWRITSNMPCASFTIREDGNPYCEGIVIDLDEIPRLHE